MTPYISERYHRYMTHGATVDLAEIKTEDISYLIDLLVEELALRMEKTSHPPISEEQKLEKFLSTLKIHNKDIDACLNDAVAVKHLKQLIQAYITAKVEKEVREAEKRGAAFAVEVIDSMHYFAPDELDREYKGLKNNIRDKFKKATGVDPAPSYPIIVQLQSQPKEKQ